MSRREGWVRSNTLDKTRRTLGTKDKVCKRWRIFKKKTDYRLWWIRHVYWSSSNRGKEREKQEHMRGRYDKGKSMKSYQALKEWKSRKHKLSGGQNDGKWRWSCCGVDLESTYESMGKVVWCLMIGWRL